jgi:hypothetical protein
VNTPSPRRRWPLRAAVGGLALLVLAVGGFLAWREATRLPAARDLAGFVHARPGVPVVFTSRDTLASFEAAAPEADGFQYPGTIPWTATEGRLRRLEPDGSVYELTWGRALPDGSTLIDVMSPSVTLDGRRILFAGRKAPPDPGRWRIYEVGVDGRGLSQLTGGPDDPGCDAVPPLRFAADGSAMADDDRKRLDYDDVDPADRGDGGILFASSRSPDLGRGHSRRATQIWQLWPGEVAPKSLTANRNNDRWPILVPGPYVLFSLWSRNREAVTADGDVAPWAAGRSYLTRPTDVWVGARVQPSGIQFGYTVKVLEAVWRQRPLFNGRIAFMTPHADPGRLRIVQADWGLLRHAPSALAADSELPTQQGEGLSFGPDQDANGRPLSAGTPSAHPNGRVLFSAAPMPTTPGGFGLYWTTDDWSRSAVPELLFDDPRLADADPVAVYARDIPVIPTVPTKAIDLPPDRLALLTGGPSVGPFGLVENQNLAETIVADLLPGQQTDTGAGPVFPPFENVRAIAVYAARRDRFDDPVRHRVEGAWEILLRQPLDPKQRLAMRLWLPTDSPSVLAGLDADGKVARIDSPAADSKGRRAAFYAIAGDHYSGTKPGVYHFCVGCHVGHTFVEQDVTERAR